MKNVIQFNVFLLIGLLCFTQCRKNENSDTNSNPQPQPSLNNTKGFGVLNRIKGIWNGPVTSTTALGSYPEWIVDFRPVSENQISAKNELDSLNDIHMSFFIAKYNNQYCVCFRNGGSFAGQTRVSYFLADSVRENSGESYYRFSEIINGTNRAYTELIFRADSLIMKSFTNQYNTLAAPTLHMSWAAQLQDTTACQPAVTLFDFPKKTLTKDFTSTFTGQTETVYYSTTGGDPYTENQQPYLGKAIVNFSYSSTYTPDPAKKTFLIITTQPLISGFSINQSNLKFRSRYVILSSTQNSYTFNYMHPGTYYLYALYDADGNQNFSSGDWVSSGNTSFSLASQTTVNTSTLINFTIP